MDKYIFDESNGLWYELQGDYYIPCLILSEEETQPIGLWGQRHREHLMEHKHLIYTTMLLEGTLNRYLADINQQAEQMFHRLIKEMAEKYQRKIREIEKPCNFSDLLPFCRVLMIFCLLFNGVNHFKTAHPFPQSFGDDDGAIFKLVLLDKGREDAAGGKSRAV